MLTQLKFFKQEYKYLLIANKVSANSLKNYLSDINNFIAFIPSFDEVGLKKYLDYLAKVPKSTKSRRIFSLKKFLNFLYQNKYIFDDLARYLKQAPTDHSAKILKDYRNHLEASKASKNTVKNYISDIKHFLNYF